MSNAVPTFWHGMPDEANRGCSLGNESCFVRATADADLDSVWLAANNRWYTGELVLRILPEHGFHLQSVRYGPTYQSAFYTCADGATLEKRIFLHSTRPHVYMMFTGRLPQSEVSLTIRCDWRVVAARSETHRQQPFWQECERRWTLDNPPATSDTRHDLVVRPLDAQPDSQRLACSSRWSSATWTEPSRVRLAFEVPVDAQGNFLFWVCLSVDADASADDAVVDAPTAFAEGESAMAAMFDAKAHTETPSPIEQAVGWGIVGSRRVWHRYPTGDMGFTNDPPGNTIVTRDAAWFIFGADHFAPAWSRALLATLLRHAVYPTGKIAEFVKLGTDGVVRDDYGLNLNDATPLFVLALAHHARATQDLAWLSSALVVARSAAEWILQQRHEDGLIWCDGKKTNVWGIAGWRNIVPGYQLSGALTELNAECVAALRAVAGMAELLGLAAEQQRFSHEAEALSAAMEQLVDRETGLFVLNRGYSGRDDVVRIDRQLTVDLAFPALFQAGPEEARLRTLERLLAPDFRGPCGPRTLSAGDPAYHPRFGWGLMGGIWPNAVAWVAAAAATHFPAVALELTEQIAIRLFPAGWNGGGVSVPGQFPEWFDGDTGESAGMSLSPWMPATFVWLVREGLLGRVPGG